MCSEIVSKGDLKRNKKALKFGCKMVCGLGSALVFEAGEREET